MRSLRQSLWMARALVKSEGGFGPHFQGTMIAIMLTGMMAVVVVGGISRKGMMGKPVQSVVAMEDVAAALGTAALPLPAEGTVRADIVKAAAHVIDDEDDLECPSSDEPMGMILSPEGFTLCCADPDGELTIGEQGSCRAPGGWALSTAPAALAGTMALEGAEHMAYVKPDGNIEVKWAFGLPGMGESRETGLFAKILIYGGLGAGVLIMGIALLAAFGESPGLAICLVIMNGVLIWAYVHPYGNLTMDATGSMRLTRIRGELSVPSERMVVAGAEEDRAFVAYRDEEGGLGFLSIAMKDDAIAGVLARAINDRILRAPGDEAEASGEAGAGGAVLNTTAPKEQ